MTCCQSDTHVVNKTTKKREKNRDVWDRPCVKPGQTFIFPAARCVSVIHLFVGVSSGVWFVQRSPHWSTSAESEERSCWRIRTASHILITPRVGLKSIHQPEETEQKQIPLLTDVLTLEIMMSLLYLLLLLLPSFSFSFLAHIFTAESGSGLGWRKAGCNHSRPRVIALVLKREWFSLNYWYQLF